MANRNKKNGWAAAEEEEIEHHDTDGHPELFKEEAPGLHASGGPGDDDDEDEDEEFDDEDDKRFTGGLKPVKPASPSYLHLLKMNNQAADKIV